MKIQPEFMSIHENMLTDRRASRI